MQNAEHTYLADILHINYFLYGSLKLVTNINIASNELLSLSECIKVDGIYLWPVFLQILKILGFGCHC